MRNDVRANNAMPSRMAVKKHASAKHAHKFRHSRIVAADNGGFTVEHAMHGPNGEQFGGGEQQHAFSNAKDMHAHLQDVYPEGTSKDKAQRANEMEEGEQA